MTSSRPCSMTTVWKAASILLRARPKDSYSPRRLRLRPMPRSRHSELLVVSCGRTGAICAIIAEGRQAANNDVI